MSRNDFIEEGRFRNSGREMANIEVLRSQSAKEIEVAIDKSFEEGRHVLLLYDDEMEGLFDKFLLECFAGRAWFPPYDFVVGFPGNEITTRDEFYVKCRTGIHLADYMGDNLNALHDILTHEALSPDPRKRTLWVWYDAHVLYSSDPQAFQEFFETMVGSSTAAITGELGGIGGYGDHPARPVRILLTGRWEVIGDEASRDDSFLYWLRQTWYEPQPPDEPTGLLTLRISGKETKSGRFRKKLAGFQKKN